MGKLASPDMEKYFEVIKKGVNKTYQVAKLARAKGLDPEETVPIPIAKNMAERVVGLISVVSPNIADSKITERILELEKEFGLLDWRVGFKIAEEVAKETLCKFDTKQEAIEVGIRVGFAYLTLGIVSAPLEGFIGIKVKKRHDGKEYLALQYAGPIRAAGGTAAATSVILSDYVRVKMGYLPYDPEEVEINRYVTEINDYHDRVTNLQYRPSDKELRFLLSHIPVEVDGDPTEKIEVSNYKDLPRIETNLVRGGVALVLAEGLAQKAPKLWKRLSKWGKDFELEWGWLADFLKLKEEIHAVHTSEGTKENSGKDEPQTVKPNNTFIADLVAGRPILTHPLREGGFRLRYGRSRVSGFSAAGLHPATMAVLGRYIAIGTQLKVERPGKAATVTVCDTIEGPIVRLENGSVLQLASEEEVKQYDSEIVEILFLGDILFNYGDFSENGHRLVPAGYCPEWWVSELEKAMSLLFKTDGLKKAANRAGIDELRFKAIAENPLSVIPSWGEAVMICKNLSIPLHPSYTFYWKLVSGEEVLFLRTWLLEGKIKGESETETVGPKINKINIIPKISKIILPYYSDNERHLQVKRTLDLLGVPHKIIGKENIVLEKKEANALAFCLGIGAFSNGIENSALHSLKIQIVADKNGLEVVNFLCDVVIRDKAGTFIGARMGRPEKAKMRQMTGSPQVMFPVGDEGDRLRSFQAARKAGKVRGSFPLFYCSSCKKETIYPSCEMCRKKCEKRYYCRFCGNLEKETCRHGKGTPYKITDLDINHFFDSAKELIGEKLHPDLIKGIRGTSNKEHLVEHLAKGILRAKHGIYVNKDGTTRYDCTELPITHFKPKEIKTSVEKLRSLGYLKDIKGLELTDDNQILEIKSQDVILPGFDSLDESAPKVLSRVSDFIDDLLVRFYKMEPFYNLKAEEDLVGHLVIGLAPHISAGLVGRIIGFSETQGLITHPLFHAGLRRDCLAYDTYVPLYDGKKWKVQKIGGFVESLNPKRNVDKYGTVEKKLNNYFTLSYAQNENQVKVAPLVAATKHAPSCIIKIKTENGREIKCTPNHLFYVKAGDQIVQKEAAALVEDDKLVVPHSIDVIEERRQKYIFIPDLYQKEDLMISDVTSLMKAKVASKRKLFCEKYGVSHRSFKNYLYRGRWPAKLVGKVLRGVPKKSTISIKGDTVTVPARIELSNDVFWLVGLYIAEGFSRRNLTTKGYYQVSFAATEAFIREKIKAVCKKYFSLHPSRETKHALIYSSKLFYLFFTDFFPCGSAAYEKRIPFNLLNLERGKLRYLLQGYFDGDGSTDTKELRVTCDTVSKQLIEDLYFVFSRYGIYFRKYTSTRKPGKSVQEFYIKKGREVPYFTSTKLTIPSDYCRRFAAQIGFSLPRKQKILLNNIKIRKIKGTKVQHDQTYTYLRVLSLERLPEKENTYCLHVADTHNFIANNFVVHNCDGDEACVMLLMDALLNFSRQFLPERRGAKTMDAPLVLTSILYPSEVDDQVHGIDVVWKYPLEFYEAALEMKNPWEVKSGEEQKKIEQLGDRLGGHLQYEQFGFTHHVDNFNKGVRCSRYKTLPSMEEKLLGQMEIAKRVRAVDLEDVAKMVFQKHFLKDIKGNLRKFSMQQFRCVKCNEKFRRPPLIGRCSNCNGKLIFTISEGSVVKYLKPSLLLAEKYGFPSYLKQTLDILKEHIDSVFGKEKDKQVGLGSFMS